MSALVILLSSQQLPVIQLANTTRTLLHNFILLPLKFLLVQHVSLVSVTMSSLGCPKSIDPREATGSIDRVRYSNEPESSQLGSDLRPNPRRCSVPDCDKTAKRGGRCIAHGGGNRCNVEGCSTSVVSRGLCVAHGGGKRCQTPACTKSAQSGGFCWVHGGGKKCGYQGCPKRAQSGGACIAHGGGKRCRIDGCNKVVQYDRLCVGHGGYRRCVSSGCDKRAMANDFCQHHGGSSICRLENCFKRAVRGGICSEHKAQASLEAVTACGLSTTGQSSDEDQGRRTAQLTAANSTHRSGWRGARSSNEFTSKSSAHLPLWLRNAAPREDSPEASALLHADNACPSFTMSTKTFNARYVRHQHPHHKVFPKLPRLEALQTLRSRLSPCSLVSDSPVQPELRLVATEDLDRLKQLPTAGDYREEDSDEFYSESSKLYGQSYHYRKNGGFPAWSRRLS